MIFKWYCMKIVSSLYVLPFHFDAQLIDDANNKRKSVSGTVKWWWWVVLRRIEFGNKIHAGCCASSSVLHHAKFGIWVNDDLGSGLVTRFSLVSKFDIGLMSRKIVVMGCDERRNVKIICNVNSKVQAICSGVASKEKMEQHSVYPNAFPCCLTGRQSRPLFPTVHN